MIEGYPGEIEFKTKKQLLDIMYKAEKEKVQEKEKKTAYQDAMRTVRHDQQSGMRRTEKIKNGMAQYNAMRTVEHDQLSGMKRTSDILKGQIDILNDQISYAHFAIDPEYRDRVISGEAPTRSALYDARDQLERKKDGIDRQLALGTGKRTLSETSAEVRNLLHEYNAGLVNRLLADYKLQQMDYTKEQIRSLAEYEKFQSDYQKHQIRKEGNQQFAKDAPVLATAASVLMTPLKPLGNIESVRGILPKGFGGYITKECRRIFTATGLQRRKRRTFCAVL